MTFKQGTAGELERRKPNRGNALLLPAQEKLASEAKWIAQFEAGETVTDVFDLP